MKIFPNKTTAVEQSKPQREKTTDTKQSKKCYPESCGFLVKSMVLKKPHKVNVRPLDTPNN